MTSPVLAKTAEITIYLHNYKLVNYNMETAEFRQFEGVKVHGFLAKTAEIRQFKGGSPRALSLSLSITEPLRIP